jgi:hypothetical protein
MSYTPGFTFCSSFTYSAVGTYIPKSSLPLPLLDPPTSHVTTRIKSSTLTHNNINIKTAKMCQKSIKNFECCKCKHIIGKTESNHRCSDVKSKKIEFGSCGNVEEKVTTKRDDPCSTCKHENRRESEPTAGPSQHGKNDSQRECKPLAGPSQPHGKHDSQRARCRAEDHEDYERQKRHNARLAVERRARQDQERREVEERVRREHRDFRQRQAAEHARAREDYERHKRHNARLAVERNARRQKEMREVERRVEQSRREWRERERERRARAEAAQARADKERKERLEKGKGKEREHNPTVKPLAALIPLVSHSKPIEQTEVQTEEGPGITTPPEPEQEAGVSTQPQPEPESKVLAQQDTQEESQVLNQPETHPESSFTAIQDWAFPSAEKTVADDLKEAQAHDIA